MRIPSWRAKEAGKKMSAPNAQKVRDAISTLTALMAIVEPPVDPDTTFGNQMEAGREALWGKFLEAISSDAKLPPSPTLDDVRKSLQAMIDLIPSADARENLEGDGDGDNDPEPVLQTGLGYSNEVLEQLKKQARAPVGSMGEAGDVNAPGAENTVEDCPTCDGTGKIKAGTTKCPDCGGSGNMKESLGNYLSEAAYDYFSERDFSTPERVALAKKGQAIPVKDEDGNVVNGRYPVENSDDLKNAVRAIGRGSNQDEVKAHIKKQAKRLGATDVVPDNWDLNMSQNAESAPPGQVTLVESGSSALMESAVSLQEGAIAKDGVTEIKIIRPGWGSSGYYPRDVLESDGPTVFKRGTKMFWDHPTKREEIERPERSIRDLAAEFVEDARYVADHPRGEGLYAKAKVFNSYKEAIEELAPHIGASIRAYGEAKTGQMEGKKGPIVSSLKSAASVDFVTVAGAGGEINTRFVEAGRQGAIHTTSNQKENTMDLQEAERKTKEAEERASRAEEALMIREAQDVVDEELAKVTNLPDVTKARIREQAVKNPPVKESKLDVEKLKTTLQEAIKVESDYLAIVTGRKTNFQNSSIGHFSESSKSTKETEDALAAGFASLGLSEAASKTAAAGRS